MLFVENHAVFADTVRPAFLAEFDVVTVQGLASARGLLGEAWDAVLVDYDLDGGRGDELARELRHQRYDGAVIATSAHEAGNAALMLAGADAVCQKADFEGIGHVIRRWVE